MDPQVYKITHNRIRDLGSLTDAEAEPLATSVSDSAASPWHFVADDTVNGNRTVGIGARRMLLLGPQRRVPAENLLSAISYMSPAGDTIVPVDTMDELPAQGNIDKIYRVDHEPGCGVFYVRWVEHSNSSGYAWIATNVPYRDGEGTAIYDVVIRQGLPVATRAIDLTIASPDVHDNNVLAIVGKKLVHTKSGIGEQGAFAPGLQSVNDFGDTVKIPVIGIDSTGHTNSLTFESVTMPDTPSSTLRGGLVQVAESNSYVSSIGNAKTKGTASNDGYLLVAPADHIHKASPLRFTNMSLSGQPEMEYSMSSNASLNMLGLNIYPAENSKSDITDGMLLIKETPNNSLWKSDRNFDANTYSGWTGSYIINTYSSGIVVPTVLSHISNITKHGIYLATADIGLIIHAAAVGNSVANVPYEYACEIAMTGDSITRMINFTGTRGIPNIISGEYTDNQRVTITALLDLSNENAVDLSARIHVYGAADSYIFKGICTSFKIARMK